MHCLLCACRPPTHAWDSRRARQHVCVFPAAPFASTSWVGTCWEVMNTSAPCVASTQLWGSWPATCCHDSTSAEQRRMLPTLLTRSCCHHVARPLFAFLPLLARSTTLRFVLVVISPRSTLKPPAWFVAHTSKEVGVLSFVTTYHPPSYRYHHCICTA